jgi:hypothetical protein
MAKEIPLKEIEIEKGGAKEKFNYKQNIERILDFTPQGGFSLGDVRLCNKIQKVIDSSNGSLVLEENQWNFLKKKLESFRWGAPHPAIEEFADAILKAETVSIAKEG